MRVSDPNVSQRPPDYKFIQQKLPASHPVLTVGSILPTLFILSIIFIGLGIGMWMFVESIPEETILYSDCLSVEYPDIKCEDIVSGKVPEISELQNSSSCHCKVEFVLQEDMEGTVFMYYALTNFYQNHLRYSLSRDPNQLKGNIFEKDEKTPKEPSSLCGSCDGEDEISHACVKVDGRMRYIFPCGLQASTMFNDVITLEHVYEEEEGEGSTSKSLDGRSVPLLRTGIAWESDRMDKFRHPKRFNNVKDPIWMNFTKPLGWKKSLWELDLANFSNNGLQNEEFINWMKTAAFPSFRKLYRILDVKHPYFKNGLPAGNYTLNIEYNFPVTTFEGNKYIILTNTRMTAARNHFLASAFIVNGLILLVVACVFLLIHMRIRKSSYFEYKYD